MDNTTPSALSPEVHLTRPGWDFVGDIAYLLLFVDFIHRLTTHTDHLAQMAADALRSVRHLYPEDPEPQKRKSATERLGEHEQLLLQMMHCRGADSYLIYISDLLSLIFKSHPETMRSAETVRVDEILQYDNMNDVISALAERKVSELAYQGMRELSRYLSKHVGFEVFNDKERFNKTVQIIEIRNLIVNRIFVSRIPKYPVPVGQPIKLTYESTINDLRFLLDTVSDTDRRAAAKFGLASGDLRRSD